MSNNNNNNNNNNAKRKSLSSLRARVRVRSLSLSLSHTNLLSTSQKYISEAKRRKEKKTKMSTRKRVEIFFPSFFPQNPKHVIQKNTIHIFSSPFVCVSRYIHHIVVPNKFPRDDDDDNDNEEQRCGGRSKSELDDDDDDDDDSTDDGFSDNAFATNLSGVDTKKRDWNDER